MNCWGTMNEGFDRAFAIPLVFAHTHHKLVVLREGSRHHGSRRNKLPLIRE